MWRARDAEARGAWAWAAPVRRQIRTVLWSTPAAIMAERASEGAASATAEFAHSLSRVTPAGVGRRKRRLRGRGAGAPRGLCFAL
jgi:hypothetical protein